MTTTYYFTDRALRVGFLLNLDSHHINHANSKLTINPNHPEFGIETRYINQILKEMFVLYARLFKSIYIEISNSVFSII